MYWISLHKYFTNSRGSQIVFRAGSCASDFQTESVLALLNKKTESSNSLSVFNLVPKHFHSESQLHMIWPLMGEFFCCLFKVSIIISDPLTQTRKSYPLPYKLMIVEESKMMSAADVARKHGISKSMVVRWRQDEIKIRKALESHGGETKKIYVMYD